jgi:hypothetical protein
MCIIFFSQLHYQKKIKGEAGDLVLKNKTIWRRQKFLVDGVAGGSKTWPSDNFDHIILFTSELQGISIFIKNKKFMLIQSYVMPKN